MFYHSQIMKLKQQNYFKEIKRYLVLEKKLINFQQKKSLKIFLKEKNQLLMDMVHQEYLK